MQYLQVTVILHLCKTSGHKRLVVCDGIDSVNRVSLTSAHTSAESLVSLCVERDSLNVFFFQTALYLPCIRLICTASPACS